MPQIQHYRLVEIVGRGATSRVFSAVDLRNGQPVAIKLLRRPVSPQAVELLFQEYHLRQSLDIDGVLPAFHYAELSDRSFLVMPLIESGSRADFPNCVHDGLQALGNFLDVCNIVARLHDAGVIHRDLKPGNILIDHSGKVWITDFAFALRTSQPELQIPNQIVGTPGFMSPEQARGDGNRLGPATDIFSLGRLLEKILDAHNSNSPEAAVTSQRLNAGQREALRKLVAACTETEIAARPATATEVAKRVEQVIASPGAFQSRHVAHSATALPPPQSIRRSSAFARGRATVILCAITFVFVAASGADLRSPTQTIGGEGNKRVSINPSNSKPGGSGSSMRVFVSTANNTDKQPDPESLWRQSTRLQRLVDFNGFLVRPRPLAAGINRIHPRISLIVDGCSAERQLITTRPPERLRLNDSPMLQLEVRRHGPFRVQPRFEIHPAPSDAGQVNAIALEVSSPRLEHLNISINGTPTGIRFPSGTSQAFVGLISPQTIRSLSFETSAGGFAEIAVDNVQLATSLAEH